MGHVFQALTLMQNKLLIEFSSLAICLSQGKEIHVMCFMKCMTVMFPYMAAGRARNSVICECINA